MDGLFLSRVQRCRINTLRGLSVVLIGIVCVSYSRWPSDGLTHTLIEFSGLMAIMAAIAGRLWSILYIGGKKSAVLVTDGPYSMMRNPLYFFSLIGVAGVGAQTGSILAALFCVSVAFVVFNITIAKEESFLSDRFGESYKKYLVSTPRLIPQPSLWRDRHELEIKPGRFLQTLADGALFLIAWPMFELVKVGQAVGMLPMLFRLPF